ncbi:MAG TPA: glycosyltransferase family 1 protein [Solirubrobacteraceae bacterium]|nr:glycosyltransferase family 1 protein [Solirubrobacteraceae bacterium]
MNQQSPLTIGIDARAASEVPAGRGRVVRELLRSLTEREHDDHRYILYARSAWTEQSLDERFSWRLIGARDPWWHVLAARAANRQCDVFLSSNSYLTTAFTRIPTVPIVYDMVTFEPSMRPNRRSTVIERLTLGVAVRRSALLLAISQATADALGARFPKAVGRTVVAPLGVTPALAGALSVEETETLPGAGFVLAVGTLEPRKNLPRLVEAYRRLDRHLQEQHPLVVVGALGWETGTTLDALRSLGDRCTMLGHVSDAALAELYRRCAVFCYPSLGEGFGLPVLEAMAAGAAVLTSNLSSLPEVGGDAVEYVDPRDVIAIAAGLERLLASPAHRAELGARALTRSRDFTWTSFAEQTLAVLDGAARGG